MQPSNMLAQDPYKNWFMQIKMKNKTNAYSCEMH